MGLDCRVWLSIVAVAGGCVRERFSDGDDGFAGDGGVEVGPGLDADGGDATGGDGCLADPRAPQVSVNLWPGRDPEGGESDIVLGDYACVIQSRSDYPAQFELVLDCTDENGPLADTVDIALQAQGIVVPASLGKGIPVRARVYTWRDAEHFPNLLWRSANHFALYRDETLVLAGGSGLRLPTDAAGEDDPDFFAPVVLATSSLVCSGPPLACHETWRGVWEITVGEEVVTSPALGVVNVGGYDVHLGDLVTDEYASCDEPRYARLGFAAALP